MSRPVTITAAVLDKILAFLAPLFLGCGMDDLAIAQDTASATLLSYGARTDRELRLAALCIAFGFGALDALSRAADPELALNQVIRLRGSAGALHRAAQQNETRLEKLRKQSDAEAQPVEAILEEPAEVLPASSATADLLAFARSKLKSMMSSATPAPVAATPVTATPVAAPDPLSRPQRRDLERKAEKVRKQQQEEAKRLQRAAQLAAQRLAATSGVGQRLAATSGAARQSVTA